MQGSAKESWIIKSSVYNNTEPDIVLGKDAEPSNVFYPKWELKRFCPMILNRLRFSRKLLNLKRFCFCNTKPKKFCTIRLNLERFCQKIIHSKNKFSAQKYWSGKYFLISAQFFRMSQFKRAPLKGFERKIMMQDIFIMKSFIKMSTENIFSNVI